MQNEQKIEVKVKFRKWEKPVGLPHSRIWDRLVTRGGDLSQNHNRGLGVPKRTQNDREVAGYE